MLKVPRKDFFCKPRDVFDIERVCAGRPTNNLCDILVLNRRSYTSRIFTSLEMKIESWVPLPFLLLLLLIYAIIQFIIVPKRPKKYTKLKLIQNRSIISLNNVEYFILLYQKDFFIKKFKYNFISLNYL